MASVVLISFQLAVVTFKNGFLTTFLPSFSSQSCSLLLLANMYVHIHTYVCTAYVPICPWAPGARVNENLLNDRIKCYGCSPHRSEISSYLPDREEINLYLDIISITPPPFLPRYENEL